MKAVLIIKIRLWSYAPGKNLNKPTQILINKVNKYPREKVK